MDTKALRKAQIIATRLSSLVIGLFLLLAPVRSTASTLGVPLLAGPPDPRFGAIETYDAPYAATEMGVGWTRIPFRWAEMQPNGTHEWLPPVSDEALALEIAQGRQPVGLVITTPGWATDRGLGAGVPYGLHTGHSDPNNLWANFLRKLVTTYAGRIDHWIIWNEPDVWEAGHPGYTWGGSVEDFLQLQRVAYLAIKEANPSATVIFSGTSYWWDVAYGRDLYFRRYLDALVRDPSAPGNNYYCDAVALHIYFQPDFVYSITALYHQLLREHGFDKPIWIVETNAAPSLDPQMPVSHAQFTITLEEQAAYIIQAVAMGIAGGAARIGVFKMTDTYSDLTANPEPFGLVRADGSHRPAFTAYRVATIYLAGFQYGELEQRADVSIVTVYRDGGTTTAVWTRTPSPVTLQLPARVGLAKLVDMWGNAKNLSASDDGVYTLSLPGATCSHGPPCLIGGAPYLIVEGAVDGARPTAQPSPSTSESTPVIAGQEDSPTRATAMPPTPTPAPEYSVNLRPVEIKGARDVWHKRGLAGYQIELVAGPPFHLYVLNVANGVVTEARRSLEPLAIGLGDLQTLTQHSTFTTTMTTLYNRRNLYPFTVAGLFDRVTHYHEASPRSPACDTEVNVQLNGEWAFPRRIVESWADDCEIEGDPSGVAVVGFATLTPTATKMGNTATVAASLTPSATPTGTPFPTETVLPSQSPTPASALERPTPQPDPNNSTSIWVFLLIGATIAGGMLFRWSAKTHKASD